MEEQGNVDQQKGGISKRLITTIVIALLVIGGSVAAYVLLNNANTPKAKYFLAEKASIDFVADEIEERFESEIKWLEVTEENPTETILELSGEYNDPYGDPEVGMMAEQFVNNSIISITTQSDLKEKKAAALISADVAGIKVEDINFYLTNEKVTVGLPFLEELLEISDEDIGRLMHEAAPEFVSADETIDFNAFFEGTNSTLSEEDIEYFEKEYGEMIYDALSEDSFTSSDDKLELHLTEQEFKDLITLILDKVQKDEKIKELIKEQITNQFMGLGAEALMAEIEFDESMIEFEEGISEIKEEIKDFHIPEGFTSTIWVEKDLIVKRELSLEMGPTKDDLVKLTINGTQSLDDESQTFTYDFGFEDSYDAGTMTFSGDLSWKDDKIKDSIKLIFDETEISYEAEETLKGEKRDFNRVFSFNDPYGQGGNLIWAGNSEYEKDNMSSEHELFIEADGIDQDLFSLHLGVTGKQIKGVDIPEENVKDLGSMTSDEIMDYIENDAALQFQQWIMGIMMSSGGGF